MAVKKTYKFPKTMGACADRLFQIREKRLVQKKITDELEAEEKALKAHIIDKLPMSEASGVAGKLCRVTIVQKDIATAKDWEAVYKYIKKNNAFDLMQRRLSEKAVQERWDEGKKIPGVEVFKTKSLSINKL